MSLREFLLVLEGGLCNDIGLELMRDHNHPVVVGDDEVPGTHNNPAYGHRSLTVAGPIPVWTSR
ncbi:hypothetical protein ARTSIC4J27_2074 [Pseudarthrobacter siccitolerans]|uniref:Uncharacterized protein n=1 Tax=Pseudarthrobacter siccitolerans TaxID=861266 RepID=A0A024H2W7_9MICC|nr:hypothetical protein ARTSIC4J27_2074 [Pseudarthrobacter siccitolerans]